MPRGGKCQAAGGAGFRRISGADGQRLLVPRNAEDQVVQAPGARAGDVAGNGVDEQPAKTPFGQDVTIGTGGGAGARLPEGALRWLEHP